MKYHKRVLIGCVAVISIAVVLILALRDPDDTSVSQDYIRRFLSPTTRIEYQTNSSITSCVSWANAELCDVFLDAEFDEWELKETSADIDTSQWVIRITFNANKVCINRPELVYMFGDRWISIDGIVYDYEESQQFLTRLIDCFNRELMLNGEEIQKNDSE